MGYVITRTSKTGFRYNAMGRQGGKNVSLGTFDTQAEAEEIISKFECNQVEGLTPNSRLNDVIDAWLPNVLEVSTRNSYASELRRHVRPLIGNKAIKDIARKDIKKVMEVAAHHGLSASSIRKVKADLSSCLTWAVDEELIPFNPARSVKPPAAGVKKSRNVILPEEMTAILDEIKNNYTVAAYVLACFLIESGCRFGEAAELRPDDLDWRTNSVYIARAVAEVGASENKQLAGSRFYVKTPKSRKGRRITLSPDMMTALKMLVQAESIGPKDLIFKVTRVDPKYSEREKIAEVDLKGMLARGELGLTDPTPSGAVYQHGTETAYVMAKCRCEYCRAACRQAKRRRSAKKKSTRTTGPTTKNLTGHLPRDVWRRIWSSACETALGTWKPRTHDIRHANATWLLKGGMDVHTVQERLGHGSIVTTQGYFHALNSLDARASEVIANFLRPAS